MSNLRGAADRLIFEPYKNQRVENKINIIAAPTGVGKTYSIMHKLIPHDIEKGYKKFIVLTVYRENVMQDTHAYEEALYGKALVTNDIDHFIAYKGKIPMVFISTIAGSSLGGSKTDAEHQNDAKIIRLIDSYNGKIAMYWDEAHFGGSSNGITFPINTGSGVTDSHSYNATYYALLQKSLLAGAKVTGFTATPIFEQQQLLEDKSNGYYAFLTKVKDWPTADERTEIGSQYRNISFYDPDMNVDYMIRKGLLDFYSFSEEFADRAALINSYDPAIGAMSKPVMLIATGREGTKSGVEMNNAIQPVLGFYNGKIDEEAFFVGTATQDGYYVYNTKNERKRLNHEQFFSAINDDSNPLRIVLFIEKFKFGLNINNVTHEIHLRERNANDNHGYGRVTVPVIQTFGRAVRTWFGLSNNELQSVFVSDAIAYLKTYIGTKIYGELRQHMMYANTHTLYLPDTPMFRESVDQWKDRYAVSLAISQFNTMAVKPSVGLPFEHDCDDDVCPTCKRPFHVEIDETALSTALGIAA